MYHYWFSYNISALLLILLIMTVLANRFSIQGLALDWFRSYLADRTLTFALAGKHTVSYPVDCSVVCTTRLSARSTWFQRLHWGHCRHRAAQCYTIRWRHIAACQCQVGRQFETPRTVEWLRRRCNSVVQLATVAAKCLQDRGDMDRIESSHQQAGRRTDHLLSVLVQQSIPQTSCATLAFCLIPNWRWSKVLHLHLHLAPCCLIVSVFLSAC